MLCTNCKSKTAKIYTVNVGGREKQLTLCPACYEKLYGDSVNDLFPSLLRAAEGRDRTCPNCGTTVARYRKTGLVGCGKCYTAFREALLPVIERVQGKTLHVGKMQSDEAASKFSQMRVIEELRVALETAMKRGNYAAVEEYRAQLKEANDALYKGEKQ